MSNARDDVHSKCTGFIRKQLQDPRVVYILNEIHNMGCTLHKPFFRCVPCLSTPDEVPKMTAAYVLGSFDQYDNVKSTTDDIVNEKVDVENAFDNTTGATSDSTAAPTLDSDYKYQHMLEYPGVIVCEDVMARHPAHGAEYSNSVLHELIHAYDDCRANINWHNCDQVACAEIRASALSGECRSQAERQRGQTGLSGQLQKCVKRRAELSLKNSRYCQGKDSAIIVQKYFDKCYADIEPFATRP
jgi:hypothetical protein